MMMNWVKKTSVLVLFVSLLSPTSLVFASGKDEVQALRAEVETLKKDVNEMKRVRISVLPALVKGRGQGVRVAEDTASGTRVEAPKTAVVSIGKSPVLGNRKAKVAIVEFSDYECPFCARFHSEAYEKLKKDFIDTGKVFFVHKDFPLPFHHDAMPAAIASRCAGEQGRYWEMHDLLFENSSDLGDVDKIAGKAGLDMKQFKKCMKDMDTRGVILADIDEGRKANVRGTPTFVIGKVAGGKVSGVVLPGAAPYPVFKDRLSRLLAD